MEWLLLWLLLSQPSKGRCADCPADARPSRPEKPMRPFDENRSIGPGIDEGSLGLVGTLVMLVVVVVVAGLLFTLGPPGCGGAVHPEFTIRSPLHIEGPR